MVVYVSKRKIIAVQDGKAEAPEGFEASYVGYDDLAGKPMKELLRLLNMTKSKEDKVKKFAEGDNPAQIVWDALVAFEVPDKPEKVKHKANVTDNTIFVAGDNTRHKKESTRTAVYNALASLKGKKGTVVQIAEAANMDPKAVKGYLRPLVTDGKVTTITTSI